MFDDGETYSYSTTKLSKLEENSNLFLISDSQINDDNGRL